MLKQLMIRKITGLIVLALTANTLALPDDQYQQIEIQADSAIHHEKTGLTSYSGNVIMKQGSLIVEAENVTVSISPDKKSTDLFAIGTPAKFQQQPEPDKPPIIAEANNINYQVEISKIELIGNARLQQGESQIKSDKIIYMVDEQVFKAEASKDIENTTPQRVQIIIPAKKKPEETKTDQDL